MTLVVSDISKYGIVVVGDSAITRKKRDGSIADVISGAVKVQYIKNINVGIAMWGNGKVNHIQLDTWIANFIKDQIQLGDNVESVGNKLAYQLNAEYYTQINRGKTWKDLRGGFHLAGYINSLPHLYHVHNGHSDEKPHELRLYRDFPSDQGWSDDYFKAFLEEADHIHLRNGYTTRFALLFDHIRNYREDIIKILGKTVPEQTLRGRLVYYQELVKFVAGLLDSAGEHKGVNNNLSAIAFDENGMKYNEQLAIQINSQTNTALFDYYY